VSETIKIPLSQNEALVLFEFLSRFTHENKLAIRDPAEQRVLWDMCCELEKILAEPLLSDYSQLLQRARENIRAKQD